MAASGPRDTPVTHRTSYTSGDTRLAARARSEREPSRPHTVHRVHRATSTRLRLASGDTARDHTAHPPGQRCVIEPGRAAAAAGASTEGAAPHKQACRSKADVDAAFAPSRPPYASEAGARRARGGRSGERRARRGRAPPPQSGPLRSRTHAQAEPGRASVSSPVV